MEPGRNQPSANALCEAAPQWLARRAAWLAQLCAVFGLLAAVVSIGDPDGHAVLIACLAGTSAALAALAALAVTSRTRMLPPTAEDRFNALIRNSADVIAIVDGDGAVNYVTPTAERIFGFAARDLIGQRLEELVAFDDRPRLREFLVRDLAQSEIGRAHV